jgi:uncharacterized membrane protein
MLFSPLTLLIMVGLFAILAVVFIVVQIGVISYAFEKVGVPPAALFSLFLLSWVGSWVNIPVARLRQEAPMREAMVVRFFGQHYPVPQATRPRHTVLAVNLGGAVIPCLLAIYLFSQAQAPLRVLLATAGVGAITHWLARPLRGVGIAVPLFIPPLSAALLALLLVPSQAPLTAYIAGTVGTLVGADLLNLHRLGGLGGPVASIGGAGTFDGVFLTGILAVLLA